MNNAVGNLGGFGRVMHDTAHLSAHTHVSRKRRWLFRGLSVLLLGVVAGLDHLTGQQTSLSLLYLLPLAVATWFVARSFGIVLAVLAGAYGSLIRFHDHPIFATQMWNAGMRFGVF